MWLFVENSTAQTTPHPPRRSLHFCVCVRADATRCKHWCQLVLGRRLGLLKHIFWDFLVRWLCKASKVFCVCVVGGEGWESEWREAQGSEVIMSDVIRPARRLAKAYIMVLMMVGRSTGESLCACLLLCSKAVKGDSWKVREICSWQHLMETVGQM